MSTTRAGELARLIGPGAARIERRLPGPIDRVWAYLTDPELRGRWLAPGPMEGRVGGRVELRFRHADLSREPDTVPERYREVAERGHVMHGVVTAYDPPRRLRYTWHEDVEDATEVTFDLEDLADGSVRLVITHRRLDGRDELVSVASGWHTHLQILVEHLGGREPPPFWRTHVEIEPAYEGLFARDPSQRPLDAMATLGAAPDGRARLRFRRHLGGSPPAVWRCLSEPDALDRWYPVRLRYEPTAGGRATETFVTDGREVPLEPGTVAVFEPLRRLALDFVADVTAEGVTRPARQRVDIQIVGEGDDTHLTFEHTFEQRSEAIDLAAGWHACLAALGALVEGRTGASDLPDASAAYRDWFGDD
jgi:uncharacterized protein YndB with AHSA1/START domain